MIFVKPGHPSRSCSSEEQNQLISSSSSLTGSEDWIFLFDLPESHYAFPQHIVATSLRPDIVIYSNTLKRCILGELTSPFEDRVLASMILKSSKYAPLQAKISEAGWMCELLPFEVGARGYVSSGMNQLLNVLGISKKMKRAIRRSCGQIALRCSHTIYLHHKNPLWPPLQPFIDTSVDPIV